MYTGSLAPISNKEDWIVQSPLIDEDGTEINLTSATLKVYICREGCPNTAILTGTIADGAITLPTDTSFQWQFTPTQLAVLCAGTYLVFLRVTIDGITTQVLACTVTVIEGGPST